MCQLILVNAFVVKDKRLLEAMEMYGKDWVKIAAHVGDGVTNRQVMCMCACVCICAFFITSIFMVSYRYPPLY